MDDSKYYTWTKDKPIKLNEHFNSKEFSCKCTYEDCKDQCISKDLVQKLTEIRDEYNKNVRISSGYRCAKHQAALKEAGLKTASKQSTHELGDAADFFVQGKDTQDILENIKTKFDAVGFAKTFIHVDMRSDKKRFWTY